MTQEIQPTDNKNLEDQDAEVNLLEINAVEVAAIEDVILISPKDVAKKIREEKRSNTNKEDRTIYIYRAKCLINNKIYIGQSVNPIARWQAHIKSSENSDLPFHLAIKKHGADNFKFDIIDSCNNTDAANELETKFVTKYDSYIQNGKGYNATLGGYNAPKSEAWKKNLSNRWKSLSDEQRQELKRKLSEATKKQIMTKGHPAQGHKWTDEQKERYSKWRSSLDKDSIYTEEVRKKMSESHKGKKIPKEQLEKMAAGIKATWEKKAAIRYATEEIYCHADGCMVAGRAQYKIVNNVRYCNKHGSRLLRNGILEVLPKKPVLVTDETRKKISENRKGKGCGRIPHNKASLTQEQMDMIVNDSRSIMELSRVMGIGRKVICRIRKEYKNKLSA